MQGWRFLGPLVVVMMAGCTQVGGGSTVAAVPPGHINSIGVQLGDMPTTDRLVLDSAPTNAQLAQLLGQPQLAATLTRDGRAAGSYRVFAFVPAEPSVYNTTVRATIEIDIFAGAAQAADWLAARQGTLAGIGAPLMVAAPGQQHVVHAQSTTVGDTVATRTILDFRTVNVVAEITTDFVGQDASIADAERYAALIETRLGG